MNKRFEILDADADFLVEVERGAFTCGIRELDGGYFLVGVLCDDEEYLGGLYPVLSEAVQAVQSLMTFNPTEKNNAYQFPAPSEPVSVLEILTVVNEGVISNDGF